MAVYITDYVDCPDIEREILEDKLVDERSSSVEVILVWHESIDREYIDSLPALRGIVRYGVGYDNIDLNYAARKGIYVCNTPDYGVDEVSDTAIGMLMNMCRGISRYDALCREHQSNWQENTLKDLRRTSEVTLGVMGAGRIGGSVILKSKALGFRTAFYDPYLPSGQEKLYGSYRAQDLEELLQISDVVSVHTPLTDETRAIIDESFIDRMKKGASLINTARGEVLSDLDVLYEPLKRLHLTSVGLDVLPQEPPRDSRLIEAWRKREPWLNGRLMVNPHTAYYSVESYREMRLKAAKNASRLLAGEVPQNVVNDVQGSCAATHGGDIEK